MTEIMKNKDDSNSSRITHLSKNKDDANSSRITHIFKNILQPHQVLFNKQLCFFTQFKDSLSIQLQKLES